MTLNHSKTWPVSTLAVVQLRVDSHGRTYSTFPERDLENHFSTEQVLMTAAAKENANNFDMSLSLNLTASKSEVLTTKQGNGDVNASDTKEPNVENGVVLPLSKKHLEMFTKMSSVPHHPRMTLRTDTVSTILDQDIDYDSEKHQDNLSNNNKEEGTNSVVEKFHVLALTRIEESGDNADNNQVHGVGRRPSIKVDNWDYIYTENKAAGKLPRCPVHRCNVSKTAAFGNGNADPKASFLPDLPLDARKTTTLRRHYYPEGGWGWVVVVCAVLVHVLNHGIQLSCSQLVVPGVEKFKVESVHFAGKFNYKRRL
ncbi:unnamed protein product [Brassicogethes aeneus]|uniref:Uncharacterized protein n=1 Tax=Brassicogethes aeneus TaxID=1431903 RepID=A0A9P0B3F3_BRAAE|nr:unnamed protein product [Brassicogethes aeneus]